MDTTYWLMELYEAIKPALFIGINSLIMFVLAVIGLKLPAPLRAIYEKKLRDDLEVSGRNAARAALDGDWKHFEFDEDARERAIKYVQDMMVEGAKEAVGKLKPSPAKLRQLAVTRIAEQKERLLQGAAEKP